MILQTPPTDTEYISLQAVSYIVEPGIEHHGLVVTAHRRDFKKSSGIFYPTTLSTIERELEMRRDIVALYLGATLDKGIAFVCP
ncbi:hypothetical protein AURDEDRAFT_165510 [Auricularia subglabra TFB-10046 SS5]|nr:hypothetical protein AURDEDRAFT_165510 [Auricularia subglabra TFB-10046 SS5]